MIRSSDLLLAQMTGSPLWARLADLRPDDGRLRNESPYFARLISGSLPTSPDGACLIIERFGSSPGVV